MKNLSDRMNEWFIKKERRINYLLDRWEEERKYEDISDYEGAFLELVPEELNLKGVTFDPFCLVMQDDAAGEVIVVGLDQGLLMVCKEVEDA